YRFYTADMNAKAVEHLIMENRIRHALQRNEFTLYYQPQVDLHRREITGLEALIRWHHPDLGLLYPNQFLPLAEDTGFITAIGDWVLHKACWQAAQWQRAGLPAIRMAVNLSPLQFKQPTLVDSVAAALKNSGLDPDNLELEITENFLVDNVDNAIVTLRKLHELGVQLAIDDFGTGYSSLSYLKKFPLNSLKIDRSFVRDISTDEGDAAIAEAIIALGQTLQLRVMAEGVETEEQLYFLRSRGCDQAQGFLIGEPLPPEKVPDWCLDTGTYRAIFEQGMFWPMS
ncbi:MAG: EAL domain-containing protein, partial [Nitrospira sp.]|nr:EAL domain-containing protein [Nitrospira sp.]